MQRPDPIVAEDRRAHLEARVGLKPLEELLAERAELVESVAQLRARHGPFGTWDDIRKTELATIAQSLRAKAVRDNVKLTEAAITDAAHADGRYIECITQATRERAQLTVAENQIQSINDRILRDQALARFAAAELYL